VRKGETLYFSILLTNIISSSKSLHDNTAFYKLFSPFTSFTSLSKLTFHVTIYFYAPDKFIETLCSLPTIRSITFRHRIDRRILFPPHSSLETLIIHDLTPEFTIDFSAIPKLREIRLIEGKLYDVLHYHVLISCFTFGWPDPATRPKIFPLSLT